MLNNDLFIKNNMDANVAFVICPNCETIHCQEVRICSMCGYAEAIQLLKNQ